MFKKLKDKLAEEVKSSPQRIQQFAQAAQAAVTSASSSISDITNNDLFTIGDNENSQSRSVRTPPSQSRTSEQNTFQDVSLKQPAALQASTEEIGFPPRLDQSEGQHQRRLSNSSFASDVSFRLPSYETPSLYHLQSDMEVSASEAEERGFSSGSASLDRVTKEQLYAAYKRTQQRYEKYRTQYADLARHYKFLERDNAKARSVLVETQDKALRRISELREQCTLEQSAKAHLEKALRLEIDERNMKIASLNTKISCIQNDTVESDTTLNSQKIEENVAKETVQELHLIDFSGSIDKKPSGDDNTDAMLTNKTEKLEQLMNKYKDSLKISKEKNAHLLKELHILTNEMENKKKENEQLQNSTLHLSEAQNKILELQEINEEIQNKLNTYEFNKMKEKSTLELDLQKALEEIDQLRAKVEIFNKREEEYAISLAENKLSIHKELESKEAEIKSLKDNLAASKNEIQSLNIIISDYKKSLSSLEDEKCKLNIDANELNSVKTKLLEKESQIKDLTQKCKTFEQSKTKADEEYKCLQLQNKQETAEKLAMIDRNDYLEAKNKQLTEENRKKGSQVNKLENELLIIQKENEERNQNVEENLLDRAKIIEELESWQKKYYIMESEIQDEREELIKLQSEIEKLLKNHEELQTQNSLLLGSVSELTEKNATFKRDTAKISAKCHELMTTIKTLKNTVCIASEEAKLLKQDNEQMITNLKDTITELTSASSENELKALKVTFDELKQEFDISQKFLREVTEKFESTSRELTACQEDNEQLNTQIKSYVSENAMIQEELKNNVTNYELTLSELNGLRDEKSAVISKIHELEILNESLQSTISQERQKEPLHDKVLLEKEQQTLLQKLKAIETENDQYKTAVAELENVKLKNQELFSKNKDFETKIVYIEKLEKDVSVLSQENTSLKTQSQSIATSLKALETEISDVRKSHSEIEREKDNLNTILKKLEETENAKTLKSTVDVQTDENSSDLDFVIEENQILKGKCEQFKQEKETLYEKVISIESEKEALVSDIVTKNTYLTEFEEVNQSLKVSNSELLVKISELEKFCKESEATAKNEMDLADKFALMKTDYDKLKDENRRLSSDIEGLQTYLAKISKENGSLNDKLRELIASSEHEVKNESTSRDFSDLQIGQSGIDKMNGLLRENSLLIEENLELKDQLRSQNYVETPNNISKPDLKNESELEKLKQKYNTLLATQSNYEKQMSDLEFMNRSVSGNMQNLQENNEKLRHSNEKLERRLDEALVSLRHLHALQENTELEYLRNILYEYLTGSGTHSITLAKVLAAVVKFDEMQTNIVLQKEKERQGLLRQLGLL